MASKLQELVVERISELFPHLTIKENHHPEWLHNPGGSNLELDVYIPELKLAIEVQGEQHYKFIPYFHGTYEGFLEQRKRDQIKRDTCALEGINLIEIACEHDLLIFLNSFKYSSAKKYPLGKGGTINQRKPSVEYRKVTRKMKALQEHLIAINRCIANCNDGDTDRLEHLFEQRDAITTRMTEAYERLSIISF